MARTRHFKPAGRLRSGGQRLTWMPSNRTGLPLLTTLIARAPFFTAPKGGMNRSILGQIAGNATSSCGARVPFGRFLTFNVPGRPSTRDEDLAMTATPHDALVERLDAQVRELVRRDGVDPQRDALVVRRIAEAVVRDHDERSLTGQVAPVAEPSAVVGELVARVSGFGPLQQFLDDPTVEEVWINDPTRVFIARNGRHELTNLVLTPELVQELTERMLKSSGRRIDISRPFVDAMLPEGHRLHVVLEGISRGFTAVNIRKFLLKAARLHDLVELGSLSLQAAAFLDASVRAGLNVIVAGGTGAGKTTLLNCLAAAIPGSDRVVSVEEVFELRFPHPDHVQLQTRQAGLEGTGEIHLRDLVRESLRMRPSRIIVGEVRAEECLDMLLALNAGLPGMCTIHANSAREALVKMCTLPLLAGEGYPPCFRDC
jgi:pilus assembly protein CpaF